MGGRSSSSSSTSTVNNNHYNTTTNHVNNSREYQLVNTDNRVVGNADIVEGNNTINALGSVSIGSIVRTDHGAVSGALGVVETALEEVANFSGDALDSVIDFAGETVDLVVGFNEYTIDTVTSSYDRSIEEVVDVFAGAGEDYQRSLDVITGAFEVVNESRDEQTEGVIKEVSKLATVVQTGGESLKNDLTKVAVIGLVVVTGLVVWQTKK